MRKRGSQKLQQGFIQAVLLFGIALMTIVLAGFALANRSPSGNLDAQEARVMASLVLQQGGQVASAVNAYASIFGGERVATVMTLDDDDANSLYNPAENYGSVQVLDNPRAFTVANIERNAEPDDFIAGSWRLRRDISVPQLGDARADIMVVLPNLTQEVCEAINASLLGPGTNALDSNIAAADLRGADADGTGGNADIMGEAGGDEAAFNRLDKACVSTSDATPEFVYYQVVLQR